MASPSRLIFVNLPVQDLPASFHDLDGHRWQVMWMSPEAVQQGPADMAQTA